MQGCKPCNIDRKMSRVTLECVRDGSPIKLRAFHSFFPDFKCVAQLAVPGIAFLMGKYVRLRHIQHFGSPKEFRFDMQQYGMQTDFLPPAVGGTFTLEEFQHFLDKHRAAEGGAT